MSIYTPACVCGVEVQFTLRNLLLRQMRQAIKKGGRYCFSQKALCAIAVKVHLPVDLVFGGARIEKAHETRDILDLGLTYQ